MLLAWHLASFQNENTRNYFEIGVKLDVTEIEVMKKSDYTDRQFLNKLLDMVFSRSELRTSSAKGCKSHGKSHKALDKDRLLFIRRKYAKNNNCNTNIQYYMTTKELKSNSHEFQVFLQNASILMQEEPLYSLMLWIKSATTSANTPFNREWSTFVLDQIRSKHFV